MGKNRCRGRGVHEKSQGEGIQGRGLGGVHGGGLGKGETRGGKRYPWRGVQGRSQGKGLGEGNQRRGSRGSPVALGDSEGVSSGLGSV